MPWPLRVRRAGNLLNLSTPLGLLLARAGGAQVRRGADGLLLAGGYRWRFPTGGAFTVGDVVITRHRQLDRLGERLLAHEARHTWQWLALGPAFLPAYGAATTWSWLRTGDRAAANPFERWAGLSDGGYRDLPRRDVRVGLAEARLQLHRRLPAAGRCGRSGGRGRVSDR